MAPITLTCARSTTKLFLLFLLVGLAALPPQLTEAIEQKQRADQESQRMELILAKKRQEAERKRIEAMGISDFQTIVTQGISNQLLRWKGVEAMEKLANSPNTKVIIVGTGEKTDCP